jgi:hypothetical protein
MPVLRYDDALLGKLRPSDGLWVRNLCTKPDPTHAALANTIERWFVELGCNKRLLASITSAKDTEFLGALWELAAARLFHNAGFEIVWKPQVEQTTPDSAPKTPDFRAARGDIDPLVEVLNLNPSAYERSEDERRARLARDLQTQLSFRGSLTLGLLGGGDLNPYPESVIIDDLAEAIEGWWRSGRHDHLRIDDLPIRLYGTGRPNGDVLDVIVGPAGRFLSADRIRTALQRKLGSYQDLAAEQLLIFVGSDYWTHSTDTLLTAMFGETQLSLAAGSESFSGEGLMTEHPVFGHDGGRLVSGCLFARFANFNAESGFFDLYVGFIHNPLAGKPLPNEFLHSVPEFQWSSTGGHWIASTGMALQLR